MSRKKLHSVHEVIETIKAHNINKQQAARFVEISLRDQYITHATYDRLRTLIGF